MHIALHEIIQICLLNNACSASLADLLFNPSSMKVLIPLFLSLVILIAVYR